MDLTVEAGKPALEIGWIALGRFDPTDLDAARGAAGDLHVVLSRHFPDFDFRVSFVRRRDPIHADRPQPVDLLERGGRERDALRLDFAFVIVEADLAAYYKPFALGVPSKAMNVAVLSTSRIDPDVDADEASDERKQRLRARILALSLHLFGHLNDLTHSEKPDNFMYDLKTVSDLDDMKGFNEDHLVILGEELAEEADVRLEESRSWRGKTGVFYMRAAWSRGVDIIQSVVHARPWLFPVRLSKLTTAAFSSLLVLMTTAEAWDLGMSQSSAFVIGLSLLALAGTVTFIVKRQRLLIRRHQRRLSEQRVIANMSTVISVVVGMTTTYAGLFAGTLGVALIMFPEPLVATWAASIEGRVELSHFLVLSGFVASLGLIIGALGASFEATDYFRHITYADEET